MSKKVYETTLIQMQLDRPGGMSYVIRLSDGRFVIIDGGHTGKEGDGVYETNTRRMWKVLRETCGEEKPVIACWFITHTHIDHMGFAAAFMTDFRDELVIERFAYNYPVTEPEWREWENEKALNNAMALYTDAEKYVMHTGDTFTFADLRVDVLLSAFDQYPPEPDNPNQTSAVLRLTFTQPDGTARRAVIMGDCQSDHAIELRNPASRVYREDSELKADILQVTHHGLCVTGYSKEPEQYYEPFLKLYQAINPSICLWPVYKERFMLTDEVPGEGWCRLPKYPYHYWLHQSVPEDRHFHHSQMTEITLRDLSVRTWIEE